MTECVKIGILGCGPRGVQMARIVKLVPELMELVAMSDPDPEKLKFAAEAFPEIKLSNSSDELLDSGVVDAVITEIPPAIHTEFVVKALERGIHVLGEIPVVDSIEEGELLWRKVNESSALYMCGANPNYRAKTGFLLKLNKLGLIGNVAYIETEYMHDMRHMEDEWRVTYETCRYCTHSLGPVLALLKDDEFVSVSCMSTGDHFSCGRSHNAMSALMRTKNNVVVRFLTGFSLPYAGPPHTTKIYGEKGIVELYNDKARIYSTEFDEFSSKHEFIEFPFGELPGNIQVIDQELFHEAHGGHNGCDILMLRDFADAIINGKPSPIGIREGLAMTLPGIYAALSARQGGTLTQITYPWSI